MTRGATGANADCVAGSSASVVTGRVVVFRTGVNPVRGLFLLLGVVVPALRSVASTPSDVNPWTGAGSSPSSGAARFLPATVAVVTGMGSWGLTAAAFAGSRVLARKTDEEARRFSGVLQPRSVEGPEIARERDGEVDGATEVDGDDLVYRAGASRGCWVIGLLCLEVDAVGWIGFWLASASLRVASLDCKDFTFRLRVSTLALSFFFSL